MTRMPTFRSRRIWLLPAFAALFGLALAFGTDDRVDRFRQLEEILPTPNVYRTASGAPGKEYWQQRADYAIDVELDDEKQHITGSETITYTNNSPDSLAYLWVQLDPNIFAPESHSVRTAVAPDLDDLAREFAQDRVAQVLPELEALRKIMDRRRDRD